MELLERAELNTLLSAPHQHYIATNREHSGWQHVPNHSMTYTYVLSKSMPPFLLKYLHITSLMCLLIRTLWRYVLIYRSLYTMDSHHHSSHPTLFLHTKQEEGSVCTCCCNNKSSQQCHPVIKVRNNVWIPGSSLPMYSKLHFFG